jgi:hypothetical protein
MLASYFHTVHEQTPVLDAVRLCSKTVTQSRFGKEVTFELFNAQHFSIRWVDSYEFY